MPKRKIISDEPLSKFVVVNKTENEYPDWMYDEHYQTTSGIAVHPDKMTTYPKKLNAKQRAEVAVVVAKIN